MDRLRQIEQSWSASDHEMTRRLREFRTSMENLPRRLGGIVAQVGDESFDWVPPIGLWRPRYLPQGRHDLAASNVLSGRGLDDLDSDLYQALIQHEIDGGMPADIVVRRAWYENPAGEELVAARTGAEALGKAVSTVEVLATLGPRRAQARAEADVAVATVDDRIARAGVERALAEEELRQARQRTRREDFEFDRDVRRERLEFIQSLLSMTPVQQRQTIVESLIRAALLDEATAAGNLPVEDVVALLALSVGATTVESSETPDPPIVTGAGA
ncbi:hypothetical protein [Angustibacter speluncae]